MKPLSLRVPASDHAPRQIRSELKRWLTERDWPLEDGRDLILVVSEAVSNAVEHAYDPTLPAGAPKPVVAVDVEQVVGPDGRQVRAVIEDFGVWRSVPLAKGYRGRGLAMMEFLTASCIVDHRVTGTRVTMISKLADLEDTSAAAEPPPAGDSGPGETDAGADAQPEERLRWLEAVTDVGLAHMNVDRLLDELLEKVRELMNVDTAAVLLLDPSRQFLIATVARGIEEEVHQGVRIPLGRGFAGRIANDRKWVALERVDHDNVLNPILREKGIISLLGVPLVAAGTAVGVLHVGTLKRRVFTDQDAELLQIVADRAALAIQSRTSQAERAAASVMQRHLLPARLPAMAGLEFASRYVPGAEGDVGGDWYDVFALPSGTVCLVVGDVVGHGLAAAQSMSQLRAVLRANALRAEDPAELLTHVDEHVQHFQPEIMATVVCAMLTPSTDRLRISTAGHPPPVLADPDGRTTVLAIRSDLPLGVELGHPRRSIDVRLPAESVLCMYSDGLVERRRVLVDDNIEKLRATVVVQPAEAVCVEIMRSLVGLDTPEDDVAVLVTRRFTPG
jgi:serine phosphatase RsbU (regulator of sigma subunit)/anti-sigma regulatory factor (Ser/Thr protein kinase)